MIKHTGAGMKWKRETVDLAMRAMPELINVIMFDTKVSSQEQKPTTMTHYIQ